MEKLLHAKQAILDNMEEVDFRIVEVVVIKIALQKQWLDKDRDELCRKTKYKKWTMSFTTPFDFVQCNFSLDVHVEVCSRLFREESKISANIWQPITRSSQGLIFKKSH